MYEMLPYTNQLIQTHPEHGERLFRRHGWHGIRHPRYRDYYNGMRTGGLEFFDDLIKTAAAIWGKPGNTFTPQAAIPGASGGSAIYSPALTSTLSYAGDERRLPGTGQLIYDENHGNGRHNDDHHNGDRRDNDRRGGDYHRGDHPWGWDYRERLRNYYILLNHLQREAMYEQANYITTQESNGEYFNPPTDQQQAYQQPGITDQLQYWFAAHQTRVVVIALVIAAIWWFKLRK
ncbi:MAG: hypothetical protein ACXVIY_00905 [Mucilaginibacter sp.]